MKFTSVNVHFVGKHHFVMLEPKRTKRQSFTPVMPLRHGEQLNVKQKAGFREFEHPFIVARITMENKMIELGPHSMILLNKKGQQHDVKVSIFLGDAEPFVFEDGDSVDEYNGYVVLTFETFERRIECVAMNSLELVGRLMMLAEAYLVRTCEVENLTLYKAVPNDIRTPIDMFR